jgi:hypothetical protein
MTQIKNWEIDFTDKYHDDGRMIVLIEFDRNWEKRST